MPAKTRTVLLGAALMVLPGTAVGWGYVQSERRNDVMAVALPDALEATGLCANALNLLEKGDTAKLTALLERRLDASLRQSDRLVADGARIGPGSPNLRESVVRAAAHYERRNDGIRHQLAQRVLTRLAEDM